MGATRVDAAGLGFIAAQEGGESPDGLYRAYWDDYGKVWTIGIGETSGVHPDEVWSRAQAEADLEARLHSNYVPAVLATGHDFTQNELNGFADACWNLGTGLMGWDVGRYLRAGNVLAAANALLAYDRAGGVVLADLERRRHEERTMILTHEPPPADPHHYGWFDETVRDLGMGRHASERKVVEEYDIKRKTPDKEPGRLKDLRLDAGELQSRLEEVMEINPAGDAANRRAWRRDQLRGRMHNRRYV